MHRKIEYNVRYCIINWLKRIGRIFKLEELYKFNNVGGRIKRKLRKLGKFRDFKGNCWKIDKEFNGI